MSEVVSIIDNEIRMNSQMDEISFGKTSYNTIVTQKGILAVSKINPDGKYDFNISDWTFSDIKAYNIPGKDKPYVFYCGQNIFSESASTLFDIMLKADAPDATKEAKDLFFEAGFALCSFLTQAAVNKISTPINGASGIIIDKTDDEMKILIIPGDLYKYSSGGLFAEEFAEERGKWVNQTLYDLPALCFNRAVIAYKILTGKFPYTAEKLVDRNADILDQNYLPIELCINGINSELAAEINKGLKLNSNAVNVPGKKQKGKTSEELIAKEDFPLELLYAEKNATHDTKLSDEQLKLKAESYMKSKKTRVLAKRKIRRNTATIGVVLIISGIAGLVAGNIISANRREFCSKGLSSEQTIEAFFRSVNDKETVTMSNLSSGKKANNYVSTVSNIYVIGKQRRTYDNDQGFLSPEAYFLYNTNVEKNRSAGVYGITNLTINGKVSDLNPPMHRRKEKIEPITEENGKTLKNKDTKKIDVIYYLLHSEDIDNNIEVEKIYDTITLTYKKDRWIITDIDSSVFYMEINSHQFKSEYFTEIINNDNDVIKTLDKMRDDYPWLPYANVIENEKIKQEEDDMNKLLGFY